MAALTAWFAWTQKGPMSESCMDHRAFITSELVAEVTAYKPKLFTSQLERLVSLFII